MKAQCDICNRVVEPHLQKRKKRLCFACLTEDVTDSGAIPVFNLREKPVRAPCSICEVEVNGNELFPSPWGFICGDCCDLCETQTGVSWDLITMTAQEEWLIKSNRKIFGPLTKQRVEEGLLDNRFVPHDEVMRPLGRWRLLRDEEVFRPIINEVKNRRMQKKDAHSEITASGTYGEATGSVSRDIEEEIGFVQKEKILRGVQEQVQEIKTSHESQASRDLLKVYTTEKDAAAVEAKHQQQSRNTLRWSVVFVFVAGLVAAWQLTRHQELGSDYRKKSFQDAMAQGLRAEKAGDYAQALIRYNEARAQKPDDPELLLHLAPLTLFYDRQVLQAQRMFEEVLSSEAGVNYRRAGYLGLGLVALESHDWETAREQFSKALTVDPEFLPATFNLGVVAFFKDDLQLAESAVFRALEKGPPDGVIVITMADIYVTQAGAGQGEGRKKLVEAHKILDAFTQLSQDYFQEIAVVDARILNQMGRPEDAKRKIENMLDFDPESVDLHLRDWNYYRGRASWSLLMESLRRVAHDAGVSPRFLAAQGLAMYRSREKLDGAQTIHQAAKNAPQDPVLMALAGWVDLKLGRRESGVLSIREAALTAERVKLPHILNARLCFEDNDYVCAKKHWDILYNIDPRSMEAIAGFAQLEWAKKNTQSALRWLLQGQALDPSYIPFLTLAQEIQDSKGE